MITGWLSDPSGATGRFLAAMLPEPHRAYYRDGDVPIVVEMQNAASARVVQVDESKVNARAGAGTGGDQALEVEIVKQEVFHGILVDRLDINMDWSLCEIPNPANWKEC
jgi:hypothetical protein